MSKLIIKPQMESKPLDPTGDPLKWQRLKVRDHGLGENGETLFLWVPLPGAHTILLPSVPACCLQDGGRGGKGIGLDELLPV